MDIISELMRFGFIRDYGFDGVILSKGNESIRISWLNCTISMGYCDIDYDTYVDIMSRGSSELKIAIVTALNPTARVTFDRKYRAWEVS